MWPYRHKMAGNPVHGCSEVSPPGDQRLIRPCSTMMQAMIQADDVHNVDDVHSVDDVVPDDDDDPYQTYSQLRSHTD